MQLCINCKHCEVRKQFNEESHWCRALPRNKVVDVVTGKPGYSDVFYRSTDPKTPSRYHITLEEFPSCYTVRVQGTDCDFYESSLGIVE